MGAVIVLCLLSFLPKQRHTEEMSAVIALYLIKWQRRNEPCYRRYPNTVTYWRNEFCYCFIPIIVSFPTQCLIEKWDLLSLYTCYRYYPKRVMYRRNELCYRFMPVFFITQTATHRRMSAVIVLYLIQWHIEDLKAVIVLYLTLIVDTRLYENAHNNGTIATQDRTAYPIRRRQLPYQIQGSFGIEKATSDNNVVRLSYKALDSAGGGGGGGGCRL